VNDIAHVTVDSLQMHHIIWLLYVCLSVVCNVRAHCALVRRLKFSVIFLRHLVPWSSIDIQIKFYGDRLRGTPPSEGEGLNARGIRI